MKDNNIKDLEKQYGQYIYPEPCEDIEQDFIKKNKFLYPDPNWHWHKLWPEKPYSSKKLNILVAGCGSDQAAILSKCNPNHDFVGIDLSEISLAHQRKLIKKHHIKNLQLICGDFRLVKFVKKFDYIISTGVIHHLAEPGSALKYFNQNLKDDGVIYLLVYGDKVRYSLNQLKKVFNAIQLDQSEKSIDVVKKLIGKLHEEHPAKRFLTSQKDMDYNAGIVDLCLHQHETFYSIKEFISLISEHELIIKNFLSGNIRAITKYFIDDKESYNKIKNLSVEDQWELAQILNWTDRKIEVVCSKKKDLKKSLAYNPVNQNDIYTYIFTDVKYNIVNQNISVFDNQTKLDFSFPKEANINWNVILGGKEKLSNILNNFNEPVKTNLRSTINFMIENCLLDISLHPIADYGQNYNKKTT